ncbi:BA14K family protein [uncultured Cohaesibacter sp.]|uniref:BA14K family protein n=1 Tax=uncultured Cohaesibacter sp. TaxID=1002546 RepID=UPI002A0A5467|nr:BA14K family protein [uncultured Cohaesibacter sp.]
MKLTYLVALALVFSAFGSVSLPTTATAQFAPPPPRSWNRPPPVRRWRPPVRRTYPRWRPQPRVIYRQPPPRYCNVRACSIRYRSFRAWDCSYQPYNGPRRRCRL